MRSPALACWSLLLCAACQPELSTGPGDRPALVIQDGSHAQDGTPNPGFFFLPPTIAVTGTQPHPNTTAAWTNGAFNNTLALGLTVKICALNLGAVAESLVLPSTPCRDPGYSAVPGVTLHEGIVGAADNGLTGGEGADDTHHYHAAWSIPQSATDRYYRIVVMQGTTPLGYADVHSTRSAAELAGVNTNAFIGKPDGFTLQILFRVEQAGGCVPGTAGCPWEEGDMLTYNQADFGQPTNTAAILMQNNYSAVYAPTFGTLRVGVLGPAFSLEFGGASSVLAYLPQSGAAAPLEHDYLDPLITSSNGFGGDLVALKLDIDFSDALLLGDTVRLGDLTLCNLPGLPSLTGTSVRSFLDIANSVIGAALSSYTVAQIAPIVGDLTLAFAAGAPSTFADNHVFRGACPFEWHAGDVFTLPQVDWGSASILSTTTPFSTVYPLGLLVGVVGVPNEYSILLSSGSATLAYLPTSGGSVALTQNYVDPPVPAGGLFGGDLVALRLNVDFGAAGLIGGTYDLGDLYLCGLTLPAAVNGSTVQGFVATANTLLSGGSVAGVTITDAAQLAAQLNAAFMGGVPSAFADDHLSPTPCP